MIWIVVKRRSHQEKRLNFSHCGDCGCIYKKMIIEFDNNEIRQHSNTSFISKLGIDIFVFCKHSGAQRASHRRAGKAVINGVRRQASTE
jgi:hypothetical protein